MITVKLVGGAKKSFLSDSLTLSESGITVHELLNLLKTLQPPDFPKIDTENILIAINGVDSSALDGKSTLVKKDDVVSIIPIIHGGESKKLTFEILKKQIQVIEIKGHKDIDAKFIDKLRKDFPSLIIQAIDSNFVLNRSHLQKILYLSLQSEKNNVLLSNKLEIDILMRFAQSTQISNAIKTAGIKQKTNFVLLSIGNKKNLSLLYDALSVSAVPLLSKKHDVFLKKHFRINQRCLKAVNSKVPLEDALVEKSSVLL